MRAEVRHLRCRFTFVPVTNRRFWILELLGLEVVRGVHRIEGVRVDARSHRRRRSSSSPSHATALHTSSTFSLVVATIRSPGSRLLKARRESGRDEGLRRSVAVP